MSSKAAWQDLKTHYESIKGTTLQDLFHQDANRFKQFSIQTDHLLFDFSKQRVSAETLKKLFEFAERHQLKDHIEALFSGKIVNATEQRPALHMALRDLGERHLKVNGLQIHTEIHNSLQKMQNFVESLHSGQRKSANGKPITDIVSLGIGGSDLGPQMACQALERYQSTEIKLHFLANVDSVTVSHTLQKLNSETTLCIINSKTFTTPETLLNARTLLAWFHKTLGSKNARHHLIGVTANRSAAEQFGILSENIFEFWDFVGGRYSIWSAVGLPIAILIGMEKFKEFLAGAHAIDKHFSSTEFSKNIPVIMGLLGIWNINFCQYPTLAIIPYEDGLQQFPNYLQQLEMESNGKHAAIPKGFVEHHTAPVIWGGVGCNAQHAYMQLIHQGTEIIPIDFMIATNGAPDYEAQHELLLASCLSQSKALMEGNADKLQATDPLLDAKLCSGNRPSSTLMYSTLTPGVLGALIALYEHKVFVQGVIWGINSFDQYGVELGKQLVKEILPYVENKDNETKFEATLDSSTAGLIQFYKKNQT